MLTKQKIQHNYHNFYNVNKLDQMWITEISNPIKEFLNA